LTDKIDQLKTVIHPCAMWIAGNKDTLMRATVTVKCC